mgnify:CR=1 FL=1
MKKLILPILLLLWQSVHADLPLGDFTLVTVSDKGMRDLSFINGKIEEENEKKYLVIPHLGRAEIIASKEGPNFHAIYLPRVIEHEGKEYEQFSIVVVSISIADDGKIYAGRSVSRSASSYYRTQYIFKQGRLE